MAESTTDEVAAARKRKRTVAIVSVVTGIALLLGGLTWIVVWAMNRNTAGSAPSGPVFEDYRGPWESAMAKAGVTATFPAGPVELETVVPSGRHPFSATFTGEEVGALILVYPYASDALGTDFEISDIEIGFPRVGVASMSAIIIVDNTSYDALVEAPASIDAGVLNLSASGAKVSAAGFSVGGKRRAQALDGLEGYLTDLLDAAPGLDVESARVVEGGAIVEGFAPTSIEHPAP